MKRGLIGLVCILVVGFGCQGFAGATPQAGSGKAPLTFDALYSFASPGGLALSPDGEWLAYTVSRSVVDKNSYESALWIMPVGGGAPRLVKEGAYNATWIEAGKRLAYLVFADGKVKGFTYDPKSEKTEPLGDLPEGLSDFVWSPTNQGLAFTQSVYPEDNSRAYFDKKSGEKKSHSARTYDKLLFRAYNHWDDGTVSHVFFYDFATKKVTDVTPGPFHAPTSHLGGEQDIAFSPDGKTIAYTTNTDKVKAISTNNDVYLVNLQGTNAERLSPGPGNDVYPMFSPDGRYIAYVSMARAGYEADKKDLTLVDLKSRSIRNFFADFPYDAGEVFWSPQSDAIYFTAKEKGADSLYVVNVASGKITNLVRGKVFNSVQLTPDARSFFCITSRTDRPQEIARYDLTSGSFTILTHFTDEFVKAYEIPPTEVITYPGAQGDPVMAFLTYPTGFDAKKKYPLVFLFHGGPEGDWDGGWSNYGGNPNLFATWGYVVVRPNIHAATSYGPKFKEAILGGWGKADQEDVLKGIDYLVATYGFIDGKRVGAAGRSYGGFLVNWLNGQTDRFRCFVTVDGLFDQLMSYYSTDELWFPEREFSGTPLTNRGEYLRASPSTYAHNFKTPTLVIHGGNDYRVDVSQGFAMFTALQRQGIPSRLIYFPDESHYFMKLANWKYVYEEQQKWFAKYLQDNAVHK